VTPAGAWSLDGRVAVVMGAGRGLGLACAQALADAGALVVMAARTADQVEAGAAAIERAGGAAVAQVADASDPEQVEAVVARALELGPLEVLANTAGTNRTGPSVDYALADWDALFDVNVRAAFVACRAVGRALLERGAAGSIVNMSSQMGTVGYPGRAAYCATKHAVEGMTKALAVEWAQAGIRVNAVAPTFVETAMTEAMFADPAFRADVESRLPTRRLATTDDVANAVRYLACDASRSVTGHVLRVDGGWTAW
jgi:NAD(P)-dependent dehydrogenase (short-subunit alcohol dehydrogenase family)